MNLYEVTISEGPHRKTEHVFAESIRDAVKQTKDSSLLVVILMARGVQKPAEVEDV